MINIKEENNFKKIIDSFEISLLLDTKYTVNSFLLSLQMKENKGVGVYHTHIIH